MHTTVLRSKETEYECMFCRESFHFYCRKQKNIQYRRVGETRIIA